MPRSRFLSRHAWLVLTVLAVVLGAALVSSQSPESRPALSFDGIDDRVEVPDSASLDLTGDFTLEAWVRFPASQGTSIYSSPIVAKAPDQFNNTGNYWLSLANPDNRPFLMIGNASGLNGYELVYGTSNIGTNTWVHVAGVRSSTALRIYVNGVLENSVARTLNQQANNAPLRIGGVPSIAGELVFLQGLIDEVRVWNIARTTQDIQATMFQSLGGSETGLVGYWRMDEGAGQQVADASPFGNSGVRGTNAAAESSDPTWLASASRPVPPGGIPGAPVLSGAVAGTLVTLNWAAGSGPSPLSYTLQVATDSSFTNLVFSQNFGSATSASGPIPAGFAGWARVLAQGSSGQSTSNAVLISTGGCTAPPAAPQGLAASKAGTTATVSWGGVAAASSFLVEADVNGAFVFTADVGNVTSVTGQNLTAAIYVVRVFARNACGLSVPASVTFTLP